MATYDAPGGVAEIVATTPDGELPQSPPGFLIIVDLFGAPSTWTLRHVALTSLAARFPDDPEPEYVSINAENQAAVTLQENNHVVIVDLATGAVIRHWAAGTTSHLADTAEDDDIRLVDQLIDARREPDAIAWTPGGRLVTANEGDYDLDLAPGEFVGGRDFTVFSSLGVVDRSRGRPDLSDGVRAFIAVPCVGAEGTQLRKRRATPPV